VTDCTATTIGGHAFETTGTGNTLERFKAVDADSDGFHVAGADTRIADSNATFCSGEGLDNGAAGTIVTGSTFLNNRLDVASDVAFGNFADDNRFKTGGKTTPPQVD